MLPKGFELIEHYLKEPLNVLNLSNNNFSIDNGNLNEDLWNRLPLTRCLLLNKNSIFELSCKISGKFSELHAMNCNLHYICPQIYKRFGDSNICFEMNIAKNPTLKSIPFIPKYIYQPISAKEIQTDEWFTVEDVKNVGFFK
uniref:Uncharacterized protein n=1 Tax=Panagrolaimus davidi TaxID=227884 RepID=A0A914QQH5_9BILA